MKAKQPKDDGRKIVLAGQTSIDIDELMEKIKKNTDNNTNLVLNMNIDELARKVVQLSNDVETIKKILKRLGKWNY